MLKRENAPEPLPRETIEIAGPDALTGDAVAEIWSRALDREIRYGGDDLAAFEQQFASYAPRWMARDMRLMLEGFQRHGMAAKPETIARLSNLLGHAPRSYGDFTAEAAQAWRR